MRNHRKSESGRDKSGKKHGHQKRDRNPAGHNQPNRGSKDRTQNRAPDRFQKRNRVKQDINVRESGLIEIPIRLKPEEQPHVRGNTHVSRPTPARQYKVIFFDNAPNAKSDLSRLKDLAQSCDQLNIVIRSDVNAEQTMADPELNAFGKVFAGAAWALIHERRVDEGWYDQKH